MGRRNRVWRAGAPAGNGRFSVVVPLFVPLGVETFVMNYASTGMNAALSTLVEDLHTSLTGVQSAISLYALVVAAFLITGSKLGARHGYRRMFVIGGVVFTVGTLIAALGPTLPFILAGWSLVQGVGTALMSPAVLSMLTTSFTGAGRTKALSSLGVVAGIGAATAPVAGGLITQYLTWRVSFFLEGAATVAVLLLMRWTAGPGPSPGRTRQPFDVIGAVLSTAGFGLMVVATLMAGRYGLLEARQDFVVLGHTLLRRGGVSPVPVLAGVGLLILVAFAAWERRLVKRGRDPLVQVSILRNHTVRTGTLTSAMQVLVPTGVGFLVPVFLQTTLGFNALRSGLVLTSVALGLVLSASASAKLIGHGRMTHRAAQMGSFLFITVGCVAIAILFDPHERGVTAMGLALAPGLLLIGLGRGLATTVTDLIQSAVPPEQVSDVTGLSRTSGYLGSSFGVALAGAFLTTALLLAFEAGAQDSTVLSAGQKTLVTRTLEHQVQLTAATDVAVRTRLASRGVTGAAADELVRINGQARAQALTVAAIGMAFLSLVGFLLATRIPRDGPGGPSPG